MKRREQELHENTVAQAEAEIKQQVRPQQPYGFTAIPCASGEGHQPTLPRELTFLHRLAMAGGEGRPALS